MRIAQTPAPKTEAATGLRFGQRDADYDRRDPGAGKRGPVRQLQQDLQALGLFTSPHGATGGYFEATKAAVKGFQAKHGLPATGAADAATLNAIRAAANGAAAAASAVSASPSSSSPSSVRPASGSAAAGVSAVMTGSTAASAGIPAAATAGFATGS